MALKRLKAFRDVNPDSSASFLFDSQAYPHKDPNFTPENYKLSYDELLHSAQLASRLRDEAI